MNWNIFRRAWHWLTRTDVAALLMAILLLVAALGSCFPQLAPTVTADAERLERWEAAMRARYGALTGLLAATGAFRFFSSPLFLVPLALLAVATLACLLQRWLALGQQTFRHRLAPLVSLAEHLAVLLLLVGMLLSSSFGWREELTIAPGGAAEVGHGSQLTLRHEGFTIEHYADGSAAGYEARVVVAAREQEVRRSIRLNEPLAAPGVGLYLYGYGPTEHGYSVTLLAVHDPGYGLVIAAGFLLLLGMTVRFTMT